MKHFNWPAAVFILLIASGLLSSCETKVYMESEVHEDGSIDRTIHLSDSAMEFKNFFNATAGTGWDVKHEIIKAEGHEYRIAISKHFASAEAANAEMNRPIDTLFQVESVFEKQFRWFYTYIRYSETYHSLNRFKNVSQDDFFTAEDYAFIRRLPAEGTDVSRADSVFLNSLNTRIFEQYAGLAAFNETFDAMVNVLENNKVDSKWIAKLKSKRAVLHASVMAKDPDSGEFMIRVIDTLGVPVDTAKIGTAYRLLLVDLKKRIEFMSDGTQGKYVHRIIMPWTVVDSNADSVGGNSLTWRPPVTKILLGDYTMFAESRKVNWWALALSGSVVVVLTFWLLIRKKA